MALYVCQHELTKAAITNSYAFDNSIQLTYSILNLEELESVSAAAAFSLSRGCIRICSCTFVGFYFVQLCNVYQKIVANSV